MNGWAIVITSLRDFAAFAPFARNDFNRPLPRSSTPNCLWPKCSGRHPACRRAVASSPAEKTVNHLHVPEYVTTRQNPSVFFRAARMHALYVRQDA